MGKDLNTVAYNVTGVLIFLKIQIIKEGKKDTNYHQYLGSMTSCTNSMMEETGKVIVRDVRLLDLNFLFSTWAIGI